MDNPGIILLIVTLASFFWGGFVTPVAIGLANRFRILDAPNERKVHSQITPRGAGLGLWLGYLVLCLYYVTPASEAVAKDISGAFIPYAATGATLVFFSGYVDDMKSLPALFRLLIHLLAAAFAIYSLELPLFIYLITVIWMAGNTSAYNLIDGINGLCLLMFITSSTAILLMGIFGAPVSFLSMSFGISLAAMALGTICWNFPKAQTFLGDGGSTLLGFVYSTHLIEALSGTIRNISSYKLIILLALFGGVPVFDTAFAFLRRIIKGKSPFAPDRGHLHHRLIDMKFSIYLTVISMAALQALFLYVGYWLIRNSEFGIPN
ncbi:MAG: undecaprenyl/decaprenyl-phosphate alpha-N-acetylglucosaminyl 1-phosphate transferase [Synergistaceae bacterium]|nr:undecaprenyl/decaprenyl-phosphate alpha-N-acetylglucosaminyl 1-phosphate transferase [Synergistaceae bacterium]